MDGFCALETCEVIQKENKGKTLYLLSYMYTYVAGETFCGKVFISLKSLTKMYRFECHKGFERAVFIVKVNLFK